MWVRPEGWGIEVRGSGYAERQGEVLGSGATLNPGSSLRQLGDVGKLVFLSDPQFPNLETKSYGFYPLCGCTVNEVRYMQDFGE